MPVLNEILLIAAREVRKNLRSAKGLVMGIISLLGGVLTTLLIVKLRAMNDVNLPPEEMHQLQEIALTKKYGDPAMGKYLASAPPVLLGMLVLTVWLAPLLVAIMGFDGISADLQQKTVRYWTVRSRRASYFAGKFFGLWTVVASVTLMMHVLIWIVAVARGGSTAADTISWGVRFFLVTVPISAAWTGTALLVSSQFRTPIVALLVTFATFFALWIVDGIGEVGEIKPLTYIYPNTYDAWLLSPHPERAAVGALVCLGMAALTTAAGAMIFAQRDV